MKCILITLAFLICLHSDKENDLAGNNPQLSIRFVNRQFYVYSDHRFGAM